MKQWVYKLLFYQNLTSTLFEIQYEQRISWSLKVHTTKFPYGEISLRRNFFIRRNLRTAKFPCLEVSHGEYFLRQNFLTAKFPHDEISLRRNFSRWNFLRRKIPTAKFLNMIAVKMYLRHTKPNWQGVTLRSMHWQFFRIQNPSCFSQNLSNCQS